ncbi:MAG TPA: MFS transporter [Pseudonocardia sp.]|nr:MFS transporter [Pseudonocardia sp.]
MTGRLRRHPGFRRYWAASTISDFGTPVTDVALGVLIVAGLDGGAADVGVVRGAGMAPYLVVGLFAGVLVDRVRRRPLLVGTDLGSAVVLAGIPLLAVTGMLAVPGLAVLMAVFGLCSVLGTAAQQAFLPGLVPSALLPRANARLEQSTAVAQTAGPLVGGGLVTALGAPVAVLVDAVSYAVSALLVAVTPASDPAPRPARRSVLADLREGVRWVYGHATLRPLTLSTHAWFLFNAVARTAYLPYALRELGMGPIALGTTFALAGAGAVVGTTASESLGNRLGIMATVCGSRVLEGIGYAVTACAALAPAGPAGVVVAGAGQLIIGLGFGASGPIEVAYRQAITPDRLQGRVAGTARAFNRAAVVVGAPLGGVFADAVGLRPALWLAAAGLATAGLVLAPFRESGIPTG